MFNAAIHRAGVQLRGGAELHHEGMLWAQRGMGALIV
jgi:hypothetical protein